MPQTRNAVRLTLSEQCTFASIPPHNHWQTTQKEMTHNIGISHLINSRMDKAAVAAAITSDYWTVALTRPKKGWWWITSVVAKLLSNVSESTTCTINHCRCYLLKDWTELQTVVDKGRKQFGSSGKRWWREWGQGMMLMWPSQLTAEERGGGRLLLYWMPHLLQKKGRWLRGCEMKTEVWVEHVVT